MKCLWREWEGQAAGGPADALARDQLDEEQRFAYDIHDFKIEQRARMATAGKLSEHRALRLIMTGTAGTGKSRTVHGIAELRQRTVREACLRRGVPVDEEAVRSASVLVAPTGTASFQMKYGATTMHRAFSLSFNSFCGPQQTRDTAVFLKRMRRFRAASVIVMDEFSMIGWITMGKILRQG